MRKRKKKIAKRKEAKIRRKNETREDTEDFRTNINLAFKNLEYFSTVTFSQCANKQP